MQPIPDVNQRIARISAHLHPPKFQVLTLCLVNFAVKLEALRPNRITHLGI